MQWYEHLLGILAIFACIGYILVGIAYSAMYVGSMADETLERYIEKYFRFRQKS